MKLIQLQCRIFKIETLEANESRGFFIWLKEGHRENLFVRD